MNNPPTTLTFSSQVGGVPGLQDSVPALGILAPHEKLLAGAGYPQHVGIDSKPPRMKNLQLSTSLRKKKVRNNSQFWPNLAFWQLLGIARPTNPKPKTVARRQKGVDRRKN